MKFSKEEKSQMFEDYKRGWHVGVTGRSKLVCLGERAPKFEKEFDQGWSDGFWSYNEAMKYANKRIDALPEHD
jgi:ribosome modulation factor